jgi:hypothetical protein
MMRARVLLVSLLLLPGPALAQVSLGSGHGGTPSVDSEGKPSFIGPGSAHDQDEKKDATPATPPPAIPGAQAAPDSGVPLDKSLIGAMSPNDALFDAIHRGDIAAAREALNRGAQLDARNVLGQTPIDVSIDLNRNDITFLLLSMRGASGTSGPRPHQGPPAAETADSGAPAAASAAALARHRSRHAAAAQTQAQTAVQTRARPVLAAEDRGVPKPEIGFTGF